MSAIGAAAELTVARAVVAAHGGRVDVAPRRITVTLPTAPEHPSSQEPTTA